MFGKVGFGKKKDAGVEAAPRASLPDPSRPQQPELDRLINDMLEKQGQPPHVRRPCAQRRHDATDPPPPAQAAK